MFPSLLITLFLGSGLFSEIQAQDTPAPPPQLSPNAIENSQSLEKPEKTMKTEKKKQDENTTRFTALVKILRDGQDEMQAFFEGHPNYYVLSTRNSTKAGKYSHILVDSMKRKIPVHIEADTKNRRIKKVSNSKEDDE